MFKYKCEVRVLCIIVYVLLEVACYEKTLRKIVRNQSKMIQKPFSENYDRNIIWKNVSQLPNSDVSDALVFPETGHLQTKSLLKLQRPKLSTIISWADAGRSKVIKLQNDFRSTWITSTTTTTTAPLPSTEDILYPNRRQDSGTVLIETFYKIPTRSRFFPPVEEQSLNEESKPGSSNENTINIPYQSQEIQRNGTVLVRNIRKEMNELQSNVPSNLADSDIIEADAKHDYLIRNTYNLHSVYTYNFTDDKYTCTSLKVSKADIDAQNKFAEFDLEKLKYPFNLLMYNTKSFLLRTSKEWNSLPSSMFPECYKSYLGVFKARVNAFSRRLCFTVDHILAYHQPLWASRKHYWNKNFDSRYEALMRNPKWNPLKVILVPRTHVDSVWKQSFESYHETVKVILSNIIKKLQFYRNLTFSWNEVSHLSRWWKSTSAKSRAAFRRLLQEGRLEITTGGWVEPDEATTHVFGLVHELVEGHQWLKQHLNYTPKVAWLTNSVTHSPTMPYLLSISGISNLVITNLHYSWEEFLSEFQYSDFIWVQNWNNDKFMPSQLNQDLKRIGNDRYPNQAVLTHYLQFNSAGFKACGPNKSICTSEFNFAQSKKNLDIYSYNVKQKAEMLLEQYSKTGTLTPHNVIIAPVGGPYHYQFQSEFDYQYNNYHRLADFVNVNCDLYRATIEFGTTKDYFKAITERRLKYPTLKGDFLNFADLNNGSPAYWTGFFTSRPLFKILLRRLQSTLRTTEILFAFAVNLKVFPEQNVDLSEILVKARETVARLMDRNVVSGTLSANALKYVHMLISTTIKDCWHIQEVAASLISLKPGLNTPYLQKYVYRDGEFISIFRTLSPGDQIYVFNSVGQERTEIVEVMVRIPNIRIIDHNKKDVPIQINPVWKYKSENYIIISRRYFKVLFAMSIPPLTLKLFTIKITYDASQNAASLYCAMCVVDDLTSNGAVFPFSIQPIETGDVQVESYKYRLIFDELTGFLKTVVEKETNLEKSVIIDYGAFRSSDKNSGMFLFNTNVTKPLLDILMPYRQGTKSKIIIITSGQIATELTSIYGRFLQNTIKIYNLLQGPLSKAIYVESKVDYEVSPKNREIELFLSIQTDIGNGNPPEIFVDNNDFQYTAHTLNLTRRIESNIYPITSMVFIQDAKNRLTFITDHAQGVTALQEGQLVIMLDRRVLFNDGRGTNEGLADSSATYHRHYILLENFVETNTLHPHRGQLQLPSLSATYLTNSLNYLLDVFIINQNQTNLCYYAYLPLVKTSFPCDVTLLNYRIILNRGNFRRSMENSALMILHKRSSSCQVDDPVQLHCAGGAETSINLDQVLHNVKAVYLSNLVGTVIGTPVLSLNENNFPTMEMLTLRIQF